jgi:FkbM family methyltransferase
MHRNSFFDAIENGFAQTVFEHLGDLLPNLVFIDVGAYDGSTRSQIYRLATTRAWAGLAIEPSPAAYQTLQYTYRDYPQIVPVNCAVSDVEGAMPFFAVRNAQQGGWSAMLSSLDKETVLRQRNLFPDIADLIAEVQVSVRTLASLCAEHGLRRVDLLKVDAEGSDDAVIRSMDFAVVRPAVILFEHKLIASERLVALDALLTAQDYVRLPMWANTLYFTREMSRDYCVGRLVDHAGDIFPRGRDPEYGNGNWFEGAPAQPSSPFRDLAQSMKRLMRRAR